jgi:hypothetical protein
MAIPSLAQSTSKVEYVAWYATSTGSESLLAPQATQADAQGALDAHLAYFPGEAGAVTVSGVLVKTTAVAYEEAS